MINRISTLLWCIFRCNFDGQKIDAVSMYFVRRSFDERKIDVFSKYFVRRNFNREKIDVLSINFPWLNFKGQKTVVTSMYFFGKNVDGWKVNVIWMCFCKEFWWIVNWHNSDMLILVHFWKTRTGSRFHIWVSFQFIKNEHRLNVSLLRNIVLIYIFKGNSFQLAVS